jgi:predicted phage tail protein
MTGVPEGLCLMELTAMFAQGSGVPLPYLSGRRTIGGSRVSIQA